MTWLQRSLIRTSNYRSFSSSSLRYISWDDQTPQYGLYNGKTYFPTVDDARRTIKKWGLDKMPDLTVIEAYPEPGNMTRALLELKNLKHLILTDRRKIEVIDDDRVIRIEGLANKFLMDPHEKWNALIPTCSDWAKVHPNVFVVVQLPNLQPREALLFKILLCSVLRKSLHRFGRLQWGILATQAFRKRIYAQPGEYDYRKISVFYQLLVECHLTETAVSPVQLTPRIKAASERGIPLVCDTFVLTPRAESPVRSVEEWIHLEHITTSMMINPNMKWTDSLKNLGPGTEKLVTQLEERGVHIDPKTSTRGLTPLQFAEIAREVSQWPFKPTVWDRIGFQPDWSEVTL